MKNLSISGREMGPGQPCYIIAEAGVNHNGDEAVARELIKVAHDAGADAVKFQTYRTEKVVTRNSPKAAYQNASTDPAESFWDMVKQIELSFEQFEGLAKYCEALGIQFLSTPFDFDSADFLDKLGMPLFKIPSGELNNLPYLQRIASYGKPVIMSTGMGDLKEVETAVQTLRDAGIQDVVLLQCTTNYPAAPEDANLRAMQTMSQIFDVPVGLSDHVIANEVSFAAVAMGACVIEKHFTLDPAMEGPDHQASLDPASLRQLVTGIRTIESALGSGIKTPAANEVPLKPVARRSLYAARDLAVGQVVAETDIDILRPGNFLPPGSLPLVLGRRLNAPLKQGEPFVLDELSD